MSALYATPAAQPSPTPTEPSPLPPAIKKKIERGRTRMQQGAPLANECLKFFRNEQYVYRNAENVLTSQATLYGSPGLDNHRQRTTRNMILDVVAQETSASVQRVPGYDITPSTTDPEDIGAASISKQVAAWGYDKWRLRDMTERIVEYAVIQGEGFAWPYFDNTLGRPLGDSGVCEGEIRARVYGRNQVYWEPGVLFEDSRWHAVEYAEPIDAVKAMPGYFGGELQADSLSADTAETNVAATNLVRVTHYLERPSTEYLQGRHLVAVAGRQIVPEEVHPVIDPKDPEGCLDEPALHRIVYFLDPESERGMGLVEHVLDAQRAVNRCINKELEWMDHALIPQILAPIGSIRTKRTDKPGAIIDYIPINGVTPQWAPVPQIPPELGRIKDEAKADISTIAAQTVVLPDTDQSGDAIQARIDHDQARRAAWIARLAEYHSRFMRHCLYLVQRHYTEPRLLMIRGEWGVDPLSDFLGAHLRGQADVTVLPESLTPKTREAIAQQIMGYADRGWISPEKAMAAINAGTAGNLVQSYERDVARSYLVIRKIRTNPGEMPVPRPFDNLDVQSGIVEDWLKSDQYDSDPPEVQEAGFLYWQALQQLKAQKQAQDQAAVDQRAMALGSQNAARPVPPKSMPSAPAPVTA